MIGLTNGSAPARVVCLSCVFFVCTATSIGCVTQQATSLTATLKIETTAPRAEPNTLQLDRDQSLSTPELIEGALNEGAITQEERLLFLTYAVYEYESLPVQFQSNVPWRGTMIVQDIKLIVTSPQEMCTLDLEIQGELRRLIPESVRCSP